MPSARAATPERAEPDKLSRASLASTIAEDRADWLLDAIACALQDRRFLRGDPECEQDTCDAILANAEKAIRTAIEKFQGDMK